MKAEDFDIDFILKMKHSPIHNYGIPGVKSWLIGKPSDAGTVRLFECSRDHQEPIAPHSHRFDFQCWVLKGHVKNRIWHENYADCGDRFASSTLAYGGKPGEYERSLNGISHWEYDDLDYETGECYAMKSEEVHSIFFRKETAVLFFEGPTLKDTSIVLEPFVDGVIIPTFRVEDWMFKKGKK